VHVIADKKPRLEPADLRPGEHIEFPPDALVEEAGSGVIVEIDSKSYVLTNRHVIKDADLDHIRISLANRRTLKPTKAWSDESTDVAVLAIQDLNVLPARIGDSDQVEIGDLVLAIGSPFGLSHSVTHGIISAKGRRDLTLGSDKVRIQDFLQTDAAINPGNSGGPLINMRGELIGLNAAIASNSGGNEGIGFSIPINMSLHVARQLITNGHLAKVYLGVKLDRDFEPREALEMGLPMAAGTRVSDVAKGSPADDAQLRRGDIILTFNNVHVENDSHLVKLVGLSTVGSEVPLGVYRDGNYTTTVVKIKEKKK
jgi:serine protease Do